MATAAQIAKTLTELKNTIHRYRSGGRDIDILAGLDLSPAESRIALALFKGQTVKEYAYSASLTESTVRWHVKRIYQKLGVRSQSDFKHLLIERLKN